MQLIIKIPPENTLLLQGDFLCEWGKILSFNYV